jgi:ribonuclease P protein subunit RPR2
MYMGSEDIAGERIEILFEKAEERFVNSKPELAERYIELAQRISQRSETPIPREYRMRFCNDCGSYWMPGETCKVRLLSDEGKLWYSCQECENQEKYPYKDK